MPGDPERDLQRMGKPLAGALLGSTAFLIAFLWYVSEPPSVRDAQTMRLIARL